MNRTITAIIVVVGVAVTAGAQVKDEIELTRSVIQTERQAIVGASLELTDEQADLFWPIYREYRNEMATIGDRTVAQITSFADNYDNMTDAMASEMIDEFFAIEQAELKVRKKYAKQLRKVLPAVTVARFIQIENKLDALIDAELADQIPLMR